MDRYFSQQSDEIAESVIASKLQKTDDFCNRKLGMNMSKKQELKNYVINSIAHKALDPNELLMVFLTFGKQHKKSNLPRRTTTS